MEQDQAVRYLYRRAARRRRAFGMGHAREYGHLRGDKQASAFTAGVSVPYRVGDTLCTHGDRRGDRLQQTLRNACERGSIAQAFRLAAHSQLFLEHHIFQYARVPFRVYMAPAALVPYNSYDAEL